MDGSDATLTTFPTGTETCRNWRRERIWSIGAGTNIHSHAGISWKARLAAPEVRVWLARCHLLSAAAHAGPPPTPLRRSLHTHDRPAADGTPAHRIRLLRPTASRPSVRRASAAGHRDRLRARPPVLPGVGRPPRRRQPDQLTVARTRVLIKRPSLPVCTCVLITCMSQASYGRWPIQDGSRPVRQNGPGHGYAAFARLVSHRETCGIGPGTVPHRAAPVGQPQRWGGLRQRAAWARVATAGLSPPRSLLLPGERGRAPGGRAFRNGPTAVGGGARPQPANARAPCSKAGNPEHCLAQVL
jgi:hypothetical protein